MGCRGGAVVLGGLDGGWVEEGWEGGGRGERVKEGEGAER